MATSIKFRHLERGGDSLRISAPVWAESLALALRYKWDPRGNSTSYLASGFSVSDQDAAALTEALDRAFAAALEQPARFYPVRVDMGELYQLREFIAGGAFVVSDA